MSVSTSARNAVNLKVFFLFFLFLLFGSAKKRKKRKKTLRFTVPRALADTDPRKVSRGTVKITNFVDSRNLFGPPEKGKKVNKGKKGNKGKDF